MQSSAYLQRTVPAKPHNPHQQADLVRSMPLSALLILLPVVVVCAIVGYRKHRATALRRRIQHLNQLWQLDARAYLQTQKGR